MKELPVGWSVAVTDVVGSTKAIEQGNYKHVNLLGAASIIAVLNATYKLEIPYMFGGDGAIICFPEIYLTEVKSALSRTKQLAYDQFALELRAGIIPAHRLLADGHPLLVGRYRISAKVSAAVFGGNGATWAEGLLKDEQSRGEFEIEESKVGFADYSGLECRWQDISSVHGETIALIVQAADIGREKMNAVYTETISAISEIYGADDNCSPINKEALNLALNESSLKAENDIHSYKKSKLVRYFSLLVLQLRCLLGFVLFKMRIPIRKWLNYPESVVKNTDFKKFSDGLRLVLSGTKEMRGSLSEYLTAKEKQGLLHFGIHISDRALMTCLVFDRDDHHLHFVDAADGGFALAAKQIKAKLRKP